MSFASAGNGTPGHLAAELLKLKTHANLVHVPYKGAGPALNDLLGGHVDFYFSGLPATMPHVKSGKLKMLALSSATRSKAAPDVPTIAEAAIEGFDITLWVGMFAPRGTAKEIVARLNGEINQVLGQPDVRERLLREGADIRPLSEGEVASFVKSEIDKYAQIIKETGVKAE